MNETFLNNNQEVNLSGKMSSIQESVNSFNAIVKTTSSEYTQHLDKLMQSIYKEQIDNTRDVSINQLESWCLELTNLLYFMTDKVEQLNIYADMAKKSQAEAYNNCYLESSKQKDEKGKAVNTVAENTAIAENKTIEDSVMTSIYASALRIVKGKIDAGYSMVDTLKKNISAMMQERTLNPTRTLLE